MEKLSFRRMRSAFLPAAATVGVLAGLWVWARFWYVSGAAWPAVRVGVFTGWVALMFLLATAAAIVWAAAAPPTAETGGRAKTFFGFAVLIDACGLLLLLVALRTQLLGFWDVARIYVVLAAWAGMWLQLTWTIRQLVSAPVAAALCVTAAMLLFAGPVTGVPAARAAGSGAAQEKVTAAIALGTPMLAMMDSAKDSARVDWAQLPEMYSMSIFGQDVAMELPRWWMCTLLYTGVAALAWGASRWLSVRRFRLTPE